MYEIDSRYSFYAWINNVAFYSHIHRRNLTYSLQYRHTVMSISKNPFTQHHNSPESHENYLLDHDSFDTSISVLASVIN